MKAAFYTLGCKVNQYDTQAMRELFEKAGHEVVEFEQAADVYIINTCTVTQVADKKSRQIISRACELAREHGNADAHIIVAGCYGQWAHERLIELEGVDIVAGTSERGRIVELAEGLVRGSFEPIVVKKVTGLEFEDISAVKEGRTRAHLKIQEGCDRFCTYCIIPHVRGNVRSRSLESIRRELEKLEAEGFKEVVLTGIHLMSYGKETKYTVTLLDAIRQADGIDGIKRIRLGSLEPQLLTDEFVKTLAENGKICRHFHLSMQSGSDSVLRRMGRRYVSDEYMRCVELLRKYMPGCAITTDIIAGFPGETEEEHAETLAFAEKVGFSRIHVFPYSRRAGTPAYSMPDQVENKVKSRRASELIKLGERLERAYLEGAVGTVQSVLFETEDGEYMCGYTPTYMHVRALADKSLQNNMVDVKITGVEGSALVGKIQ